KEQGVDVSVVSLPAQNLFDEQSVEYKESVLPKAVRNRMSIEMGSTFGWERYIGLDGVALGIDRFGASGPGNEVIEYFGFTADNIANKYAEAFNK
ncbi:MAG: transketolase-like TK C-terminal-containing protein, partial [Lactobacillus amylovorus]